MGFSKTDELAWKENPRHNLPQNTNPNEKRLNRFLINELIEKELTESNVAIQFQSFFNVKPGEYSQKEIEASKIFLSFALKRLMSNQLKDGNSAEKLLDVVRLNLSGGIWDLFSMIWHDTSHVAGVIIRGEKDQYNSKIPPFLKDDGTVKHNNRTVMEDELYSNLLRDYPNTLPLAKSSNSFEEFVSNYLKEVMRATYSLNSKLISEITIEDDEIARLRSEAESIVLDTEQNPPAKVTELLRYIWEHREDPRVLVNLFFEPRFGIPQFIDGLKKRKPYDYSKRSDKKESETKPEPPKLGL